MPSVMANLGCQLDYIWNQLKESWRNEAFAFFYLSSLLPASSSTLLLWHSFTGVGAYSLGIPTRTLAPDWDFWDRQSHTLTNCQILGFSVRDSHCATTLWSLPVSYSSKCVCVCSFCHFCSSKTLTYLPNSYTDILTSSTSNDNVWKHRSFLMQQD